MLLMGLELSQCDLYSPIHYIIPSPAPRLPSLGCPRSRRPGFRYVQGLFADMTCF